MERPARGRRGRGAAARQNPINPRNRKIANKRIKEEPQDDFGHTPQPYMTPAQFLRQTPNSLQLLASQHGFRGVTIKQEPGVVGNQGLTLKDFALQFHQLQQNRSTIQGNYRIKTEPLEGVQIKQEIAEHSFLNQVPREIVYRTCIQEPAMVGMMAGREYLIPEALREIHSPTWDGMPDSVKSHLFGYLNLTDKCIIRQVSQNDARIIDSEPLCCTTLDIIVSATSCSVRVSEVLTPSYTIPWRRLVFNTVSILMNPNVNIQQLNLSCARDGFGQLKKVIRGLQHFGVERLTIKVKHVNIFSPSINEIRSVHDLVEFIDYLGLQSLEKITINAKMAHSRLQEISHSIHFKVCNSIEIYTKQLFAFNNIMEDWIGTELKIFNIQGSFMFTKECYSFINGFKLKPLNSYYEIRSGNQRGPSKSRTADYTVTPTENMLQRVHVYAASDFVTGVVVRVDADSWEQAESHDSSSDIDMK
ncbi:hypothetical protein CRE_17035 [Caenorhabditis remanei]|uniref:Uncharacterized protein n=1 Tax=Caenorhabditis remanei TaxID=31234 RepID=E3M9U4_CAERE|nr:hypothetical protein CRE_17035 [Caenorhabditis remanei]